MPRIKHLVVIILLLFIFEISSGHGGTTEDGITPPNLVTKVRTRKSLVEITLDYDYGGPNTRHEPPRKGKPGNGGKNP